MTKHLQKTLQNLSHNPELFDKMDDITIEDIKVSLISYDESHYEERVLDEVSECFPYKNKPYITWINVDGIDDFQIIENLGKHYNLHPLIIEDIATKGNRPKKEDFADHIFLVMKMLYFHEQTGDLISEQVSLILGSNFIITFQENTEGDVFDQLRVRLKADKGKIRKMKTDYLAYSIIDAIVDNYFLILEDLGEKIEKLEDELIDEPSQNTLKEIYELKREVLMLLKSIWPLRSVLTNLEREDSPLINDTTRVYLKDVNDHAIQIIDSIESSRDFLTEMLDIYLSSLSNKTNMVIKILTIFATIVLPLNLVTGFYGMNFEFLPLLHSKWGVFSVIGIMLGMIAGMLTFFYKKKWL